MKRYNLVTCFLVFIFIISCNNPNIPKYANIEVITLGNDLLFTFSENFELVHKISLETKTESVISGIKGVGIIDNSIYILDLTQKLLVFDDDGNFIRQIGSKGKGPEEYLSISDFYINDSTVIILDSHSENLISYDKNGQYLNREKTPAGFMYITKYNDNHICYLGNRGGELTYNAKNDSYYRLLFCDKNYHVISGYSSFPAKSIGSVYDTGSPFYEYSKNLFFIEPINDTIYKVKDAAIVPIYIVDFGKHKRPDHFMEKTTASELYREMTKKDYIKSILSFYEFSDMIYFMALIGEQNNKHIFYEKNTRQTFVTSDLMDTINNIKVRPHAYKGGQGEQKYFLSIIMPTDILDNVENIHAESNPTLVFYKVKRP